MYVLNFWVKHFFNKIPKCGNTCRIKVFKVVKAVAAPPTASYVLIYSFQFLWVYSADENENSHAHTYKTISLLLKWPHLAQLDWTKLASASTHRTYFTLPLSVLSGRQRKKNLFLAPNGKKISAKVISDRKLPP